MADLPAQLARLCTLFDSGHLSAPQFERAKEAAIAAAAAHRPARR
eukprot:gene47471-28761_t